MPTPRRASPRVGASAIARRERQPPSGQRPRPRAPEPRSGPSQQRSPDLRALRLGLLEELLPALEERGERVAAALVGGEDVDVASSPRRASSRARPPRPRARRSRPRSARARMDAAGFGFAAGGFACRLRALDRRRLGLCACLPLLAGAQELGPAAVVGAQLPVFDRQRPLGDPIEQRTVVRDEQHRPRERVERRLERLAALEVEVVGRLVEDEEVRARGDGDREREPPSLAAREDGDLLLVRVPAGEEEAAEQVLRVRAARAPSSTARTAGPSRARRAPAPAARSSRPGRRARCGRRPPSTSFSSSVVLPEPFGPTSATCSPRSTANEI